MVPTYFTLRWGLGGGKPPLMKHFCAALRAHSARSAAQKDIVSVTFGCDARLAPEPVQRDALNDRLPIRWLP